MFKSDYSKLEFENYRKRDKSVKKYEVDKNYRKKYENHRKRYKNHIKLKEIIVERNI